MNIDASIISGLVAAAISIFGYIQTRRKADAEIDEISARTQAELMRQLSDTAQDIAELSQQVSDLSRRAINLERDNDGLRVRLAELAAENENLRAQVQALRSEISAMRKRNKILSDGINKLVDQIRRQGHEPDWIPPNGKE